MDGKPRPTAVLQAAQFDYTKPAFKGAISADRTANEGAAYSQLLHDLQRRHHQLRSAIPSRGLELDWTCSAAFHCSPSSVLNVVHNRTFNLLVHTWQDPPDALADWTHR